jgi:hypothetical protein
MKLNGATTIVDVTVVNMEDGTEKKLFERKGSKCHFVEDFEYNEYIIQLRLDWNDISSGDPVLDADIWAKPRCKENRLKNGRWHHTKKEFDQKAGSKIYFFKFKNFEFKIKARVTVAKDTRNVIIIKRKKL